MKRIGVFFPLVVLATVAGCTSMPGHHGSRSHRYGAIAYSPGTKAWHVRWNVKRATRADNLAIQGCGKADCRVILRFGPGQCGTFALGAGSALGVGRGSTKKRATKAALTQCERTVHLCKVAPARCNG